MTGSADLPTILRSELPRSVRVHKRRNHLRVSFSSASPQVGILFDFLIKALGVLFGLCFFADAAQAYTDGTALAHTNLAQRYMPWVYSVYTLPMGFIADFALGSPFAGRNGLWLMFLSLATYFSWIALHFCWLVLGRVLSFFDLSTGLYTSIFGRKTSVKFYPDRVVVRGRSYPYAESQTFEISPTDKVRDGRHAHPYENRSQNLNFIHGVKRKRVATIYGVARASEIQNALHYVMQHFSQG